ncbi:GNAT superfamily N-acetyltransferase [Nocardiopsis algeriensis]|uniref:GNAT superfamily N-acetyltransferase n=2 Tax=Nocardiopsis algeriensis TaxID=1478215 RepID=A0A841ISU6_9ACTN|nr:GNAT family N-acetyltransferase [Nocardiopsis algeriensis]MBB6121959.1 GNAT superfamily N-acetyltransferase [Nocardiopsis algeriensis]
MEIREMRPRDVPRLVEVSLAADTLFADAGVVLPPDDPRELLEHAGRVLVAVSGAAPVGLAATVAVDGSAHLEQLAVHPSSGRRGIGSALLEAVCAEAAAAGGDRMTLTTFRDLPWNAPWYAARGFSVWAREEWGPGLERVWAAEAPIRVLPRVAMVRNLARTGPAA